MRLWADIKPYVLDITIFGYLAGYLFFFTCIEFGVEKFDEIFFLWNNPFYTGVGAWAAMLAIGSRDVRRKVRWPLIFCLIMYGWELAVFIFNLNINDPIAVTVAFYVLVVIICFLARQDFKKINR